MVSRNYQTRKDIEEINSTLTAVEVMKDGFYKDLDIDDLQYRFDRLTNYIYELERENERLKEKIRELENENQELKDQLAELGGD